ncbi:hypothetical protein, partial [Dickeya lacustris]|uniref:hypothetical protein n=1 Tax=Dickeya lacustris TaxID=2259638 RepID=UPI003F26C22C
AGLRYWRIQLSLFQGKHNLFFGELRLVHRDNLRSGGITYHAGILFLNGAGCWVRVTFAMNV